MYPKLYFNTESKTILAYFLAISCLLHLILIFSSSSLSHFLTPDFNLSNYTSKNDNYVIEIELESGKEEEKKSIEDEEELKEEEEEETEEDLPEEKRQLFVDTSDKTIDEEPQADTERVGEKGSIAKDMYAGDDNVNDEPRLESDADLPGDAPDVLASATQESGLPIEATYGEPVEEAVEEAQPLVEKEIADSSSDVDESEMPPVNEEVEAVNEPQEEPVVKDAAPQIENIDKITTTLESDVVILETDSVETDVVEENTDEITEPVEEYTETASIPRTMIKDIIEGSKEIISSKVQKDSATPEPQPNNIPAGDSAPFFEDNISNAPIHGQESFNVKKHEYAPYYKHIRDKISRY